MSDTYIPQDNHNCVTQCINGLCKCVTDKTVMGDKMRQTLVNSPITKDKTRELARIKKGS